MNFMRKIFGKETATDTRSERKAMDTKLTKMRQVAHTMLVLVFGGTLRNHPKNLHSQAQLQNAIISLRDNHSIPSIVQGRDVRSEQEQLEEVVNFVLESLEKLGIGVEELEWIVEEARKRESEEAQ